MFTPEMIAPCGLDCSLCSRALTGAEPCPGCCGPNDHKPEFCACRCGIILCRKRKENGYRFCDECPDFPCADVMEKENRYTSRYPLKESPLENLREIRKTGMEAFLAAERRRWSCAECGAPVCVHTGVCSGCGLKYRDLSNGKRIRKEPVDPFDHAERIAKELPEGILLNTNGEKFNAMVIGWGHLGVIWNLPTFTVYVRQSRYTRQQLDSTREFTLSVPMEGHLPGEVSRICGSLSGRDVDKEKAAGLTLADAEEIRTPGILEIPLTLECRVLYRQDQAYDGIPEGIRQRFYAGGAGPADFHTAYIGQIVSAYIIREV